jgi:hypothetical protein
MHIIFDIASETNVLICALRKMCDGPLLGGEEETFLVQQKSTNNAMHTFTVDDHVLWAKRRRCDNINQNVTNVRSFDAVRHEVIQSLLNFITDRLPDNEFIKLEPLRHLKPDILDSELRECHSIIVSDFPLKDFAAAYREACKHKNLCDTQLHPRQLLESTLIEPKWNALSVSLARLIASKPHSADVERLISSYNTTR